MPRLLPLVDAHVVHSRFDMQAISSAYPLGSAIMRVIPHGPYNHLVIPESPRAHARIGFPYRLLYFGVVRPFKGVEDLVAAFSLLDRDQASQFRLSIVGETWEEWTVPDKAIARSPHADLIERVDRYVSDEELAGYVAQADAIVLPYHRSSMSGPLHIAMSSRAASGRDRGRRAGRSGPGLRRGRARAPEDPAALRDALLRLPRARGSDIRTRIPGSRP